MSAVQASPYSHRWLLVALLVPVAFLALHVGSSQQSFNVVNISPLQAKILIDEGAVIVDVRGPKTYGESHIPGAISVPLSELKKAVPKSLADAREKRMVVYCGDGVTIGPEGTSILNQAGYVQAVNLEGGLKAWKQAGYVAQ